MALVTTTGAAIDLIGTILGLFGGMLDMLASFFDSIFVLLGGVAAAIFFGVYGLFSRFGLALLTGLTRSAGTGLGDRFMGRGIGRTGGRRIPTGGMIRHARHALWHADARLQRMELYNEAWLELLAARGGPFAVQMHLLSLIHAGFQEKTARLLRRARAFDRLEERAQGILQRYERDYARLCEPMRNEMLSIMWSSRAGRRARAASRSSSGGGAGATTSAAKCWNGGASLPCGGGCSRPRPNSTGPIAPCWSRP
jgi:hypothetical protein